MLLSCCENAHDNKEFSRENSTFVSQESQRVNSVTKNTYLYVNYTYTYINERIYKTHLYSSKRFVYTLIFGGIIHNGLTFLSSL